MNKRVLIISASPRRSGNSDLMAEQFKKGAVEAGNTVEKIFLANKKIGYCLACDYCKKNNGICVQKDDMTDLLNSMMLADVIVLASPVYFYNVSAQLKTFMDRTYARFETFKKREFYGVFSCADGPGEYINHVTDALKGFAVCFPDSEYKGSVIGYNSGAHGSVSEEHLKEAFELGKTIQ